MTKERLKRARALLKKAKCHIRTKKIFFLYVIIATVSIVLWFEVFPFFSFDVTLHEFLEKLSSYGGIVSFLMTLGIVFWFRFHEMILDLSERAVSHAWRLVFIILGFGGIIGIWFAVRIVGFYALAFLLEKREVYSPSIIFSVLSYILSVNLVFTLLRAFEKLGCKKPRKRTRAGDTPPSGKTLDQDRLINQSVRSLMEILIQGLMILIISVIPRYSDPELDFQRYLMTTIVTVSALAILLIATYKLDVSFKGERSNSA